MNMKGTTLIEMMIVLACFSVVALGAYEIITQAQLSNSQLNAWNMLTQWGQTSINQINLELSQARVIYENNTLGQAYQTNLEIDSNYPVLATSTLPNIDIAGTLHQDIAGTTRTGNALLFVQELTPYTGDADGTTRRVDIYRLIYYYLSSVAQPISGKSASLKLISWKSKEFADYSQVMSISGTARTTFVSNLYADRGIRYLWRPRNTTDTAFYGIYDGGGIDAVPDSNYTIQKETNEPVIYDLGHGFATVAWNRDTVAGTFWTADLVPKFGIANTSGIGFPHGFEIQIIGPTGARQVLVRLVLAYYVALDRSLFSNESLTIVTTREY